MLDMKTPVQERSQDTHFLLQLQGMNNPGTVIAKMNHKGYSQRQERVVKLPKEFSTTGQLNEYFSFGREVIYKNAWLTWLRRSNRTGQNTSPELVSHTILRVQVVRC